MKRSERFFSLILILFMVISMVSPMVVNAEEAIKGSLTVHKYYFPNNLLGDLKAGTGEIQTPSDEAVALKGAEFSVWKVGDTDELDGFVPAGNPDYVKTTEADGSAVFNNLPLGRYYVEETDSPKGVIQGAAPFMVDIPSINVARDGFIYDVHVYPKNVLVLGAARLEKVNEAGEGLPGAKFKLYKEAEGKDILIAENIVTGDNGFTNIMEELEVGNYYFKETEAPTGYGLDGAHISFVIAAGDHAYEDGKIIEAEVKKVDLTNYLKPGKPDKIVDKPNPGIGDTVTWTIKNTLPGNIDKYKVYDITDPLDTALNYAGNVRVTLNGAPLPADAYTLTQPDNQGGRTLIINFVPAELAPGELVIKFDTVINEKAVVGTKIPNKARLDYNNGYEPGDEESTIPHVIVGGINFKKIDGKTKVALQGAEFIVYKEVDGAKLYLVKNEAGMISWSANKPDAFKFASGADGVFKVDGLAYGSYFLEETKAPIVDGKAYSLLQKPEKIEVNGESHTKNFNIKNNVAPSMPQTGGMGTVLFTVIGLGLMGVAAKTYKKEEK